jgi:FKBP-type peptidyl-prolyl cis-trans isomerase
MTLDKTAVSYCVGMSLGGSLLQQDLGELSAEVIANAINDTFERKELKFTPEEANNIIQKYLSLKGEQKYGSNKEEGEQFLIANSQKENIKVTSSGLQYEILNEGSGDKPGHTSQVTVHYHGTLVDGTVFDSSVKRGEPATFGVNQVIPGWTEALQLMPKGSKYRLYIPQELAYGANPHPGGPIEPFMVLIFDVELIEIN